jgi:hypothetical protein
MPTPGSLDYCVSEIPVQNFLRKYLSSMSSLSHAMALVVTFRYALTLTTDVNRRVFAGVVTDTKTARFIAYTVVVALRVTP